MATMSYILIVFVVISNFNSIFAQFNAVTLLDNDPFCECIPRVKNFNGSVSVSGKVSSTCRNCYDFKYYYQPNQSWATQLCIKSINAKPEFPMFIVVRETVNIMSFQVPLVFPGVNSYSEVCRTLCPLSNYRNAQLKPGIQTISLEISTGSNILLKYDLVLSNITNFMIDRHHPLAVNITPSKPYVVQYNMDKSLRSVRVEATSTDDNCMVMAIQSIECPIHYSAESLGGYFQTLTRQSGISITKENFEDGRQFIVLLLQPTDENCIEGNSELPVVVKNREKEVTLRVVSSITDKEYYQAIFGAFGFFVVIYIFCFFICCFFYVRKRRQNTESQTVDLESPNIQNYGTSSDSEGTDNSISASYREDQIDHNVSPDFDETDMDKLPDADLDKNVVRTKTVVYVSDLARKKEKYIRDKTKIYSWNLLTVAIFYGLPVLQLVYFNQRIVIITGDQDLCYYNFLCSHQVGVFSDFNHIYSNIGYVLLGILFLLLVYRREFLDTSLDGNNRKICSAELTGVPRHYGLLYAMGWALIMEGVLSASYHVCPNKTNFQFDTAFMYVIATVYMLTLYQSRHPDIMAKSHITWMVLAVVIIIGFGGMIRGGIVLWVLFVFAHMCVTSVVGAKIYYMGRFKIDSRLLQRVRQNIKLDMASRSFTPIYLGRFIVLTIAVLINLSLDIFGLVSQPPNFGAYLLSVFITNLMMYLIYYSLMKIRYKEGIRWVPLMYMVMSFVCWGAALHFFLAKNTSWQVSPAESRERNKHCIIFNFFDDHDIWHFLSSCALFFSFMVLFTLDDDLENTPRNKIVVF